MLRLVNGRIRWSRIDVLAMSRLVGPETATRRSMAFNPSVVRLALRQQLDVTPRLRRLEQRWAAKVHAAQRLAKQLDAPVTFKGTLDAFPHQRAALHFFAAMNLPAFGLFDQTGVGKTLAALLWAKWLARSTRTLVVCPNSAKEQWADAIRHWIGADERVTVVEGVKGKRKIDTQIMQAQASSGWVIGHWESLVNAADGYLARPWGAVILDEAHLINNRDTKRSEIAWQLDGERRLALTAHPFTNNESELWAILRFLYPTKYRAFWPWVHEHLNVLPLQYGGFDFEGARRPNLLKWELAPIVLRRTREEVFPSLPKITRVARYVDLTLRGQREYARLRKAFFAELDALDGGETTVVIPSELPRLTRIRQYLIDPALLGGRERSVKFPEVFELLRSFSEPPVIFSSFRESLVNLKAYLKQQKIARVGFIHGGMQGEVNRVKKRFLTGHFDALLVVTQAGGTSLNLGKYGLVMHLDLPFTPRDFEQSEGRVDRHEENTGAFVPTTGYRIVVRDSYEERLEAKLEAKHRRFGQVFTKGTLKELFA